MSTVVGAVDEFWAARVGGGVCAVGEAVQVFGAGTLRGVSKQTVWRFFR